MENRNIWVKLYKTTLKSKQNYEVRLKELIVWDKPINERDMDPAGKWSEYDKKIKALNELIDECTQYELRSFALAQYQKECSVKDHVEMFKMALQNRNVVDKREEGFYCGSCKTFRKDKLMGVMKDRAIYPNNSTEIWIVNSHYDGCNGWD